MKKKRPHLIGGSRYEQNYFDSIFRVKGPKRTPKSLRLARVMMRRERVRLTTPATRRQMARLQAGNRSFWGLPQKSKPGRYKRWKASRKPKRDSQTKEG